MADLPPLAERWDGERTERTLAGLYRKRRRRRAAIAVALSALVAFAVTREAPAAQRVVSSPLEQTLDDGSHVLMRDPQTRVEVAEATPQRVAYELKAGQARFDVTRNEQRVFRVRCGDVTVEVLGTSFEVERDGARTRVAVSRGKVGVFFFDRYEELSAGEAGWFPRAEWLAQPEEWTAPPKQVAAPRARTTTLRTWREPAERGEFEHAYELLTKTRKPVADDVEELLLAADTARLSGHAAEALPYLRRVMNEHAEDSRASLAAFTLGGVLMQQLGQAREAESAYGRARALSRNSLLAEDALARQVEAAHRAGNVSRARELALEYVEAYPNGRRVRAVRRFGEL